MGMSTIVGDIGQSIAIYTWTLDRDFVNAIEVKIVVLKDGCRPVGIAGLVVLMITTS
jgi:hypothetical protein